MLFELPKSLRDISEEEEDDLVDVVDKLLHAVREGNHEVFIDYDFLNWIIPYFQNLRNAYSFLRSRMENYFTNPKPNFITEYIRIVGSQDQEGKEEEAGKVVHKIWYRKFLPQNGHSFNPSVFVCENSEDSKFYHKIGEWYRQTNNIPINNLKLSIRCGGGNTTREDYEIALSQRDYTLCIVDSDYRFPNPKSNNIGETAKACRRVLGNYSNSITRLKVLNCMEAENLIPIEMIRDMYNNGTLTAPNNIDIINYIDHCSSEEKDMIMKYYDLKEGCNKNPNFYSKPKWRMFMKEIYEGQFPERQFEDCWAEKEEMEYIMYGVSKKLLEKGVEWLSTRNLRNYTLLPFQESEYMIIGEQVTNYGFCYSGEPTN